MKKLSILISTLFIVFGCQGKLDSKLLDSVIDDSLEESISSSIEELSEGLEQINGAGAGSIAFYKKNFVPKEGLLKRILNSFVPRVYAATTECYTSSVQPEGAFNSKDQEKILVSRTFDNCGRKLISVNGNVYISFEGLLNSEPQAGAIVKRAPSLTRRLLLQTERKMLVKGLMEDTIGPDDENQLAVAQTMTLSDDFSKEDKTGSAVFKSHLEKSFYKGEELKRQKEIKTKLTINRTLGTGGALSERSISGSTIVEDKIENFTNTITYENIVWVAGDCYPDSGTVSFDLSGSKEGSGSYSFTGDGEIDLSFVQKLKEEAKSRKRKTKRVRLMQCR